MNPYSVKEFSYKPGFESTEFTTDSGQSYYVYFKDISLGGMKVHDFGFEPIGADMDGRFPDDR